MITPRDLFQKLHKEDVKALALAVNESWMQRAITYTLADLSSRGLSAERLAGANQFIETLTTLADEQKPMESPPDKSLKSYG